MMQQQIMLPTSKLAFPAWSRVLIMCILYASLCINPIAAYLTIIEPENREEIIGREDLTWLNTFAKDVIVLGDIDNCGTYRYAVYVILFSIAVFGPVRIFLVATTITFLEKQVLSDSRSTYLINIITLLLTFQTTCVSVFFIYPMFLNMITFRFQISVLNDIILVGVRLCFIFYMLNSSAQFIVLIQSSKPFQKV
ncbi:hypothetical protein PENTCL1PPCAC_15480, partial [Pristionchus entomophagus]